MAHQIFIFFILFATLLILLAKLVSVKNTQSIVILFGIITSTSVVMFITYSLYKKTELYLDSICLFYIITQFVPILYSIVILKKHESVSDI